MNGVLQTAWLLFTAVQLQRWLGLAGVALLAGGIALKPFSDISTVLLVIGMVCVLITPVFAGGILFRNMSGARAQRLIPHARIKLMLGAALAVLAGALLFSAVASWATWSQPIPVGFTTLLARATLVGSVALLGMFAATTSVVGLTCWILVLSFSPMLLPRLLRVERVAAFLTHDLNLWMLTATLWLGFWAWYRQAKFIGSPGMIATATQGTAVRAIDTSRRATLTTVLLGPGSIRQTMITGLVIVLFCGLAPYLIVLLTTQDGQPPALADILAASVVLLPFAGMSAWTVGRQARLLWLTGGYSRRELFFICESRAWRQYAAMTACIPLLLILAASNGDAVRIGALTALTLTAGACMIYFGLMRVRPWSAGDVLLAAMFIVACMFWLACIKSLVGSTAIIAAGAALQLPAALLMRTAAIRRWQHIDWTIHKRLPYSSARMRTA